MQIYFSVLAAVFIAGSGWLFVRRWRVMIRGVAAVGRVVAFVRRTDDDSNYYLPVVEFTDSAGVLHRFTSTAGHGEPRPPIGTAVTVRYLPANPEVAFIASFLHMWAAPMGLFILGIGSLFACLRGG